MFKIKTNFCYRILLVFFLFLSFWALPNLTFASTLRFNLSLSNPGNFGTFIDHTTYASFGQINSEIWYRFYGRSLKVNVRQYPNYLKASVDGGAYQALRGDSTAGWTPDVFSFAEDGWHEVVIALVHGAENNASIYTTDSFEVVADGTPQMSQSQNLGTHYDLPSTAFNNVGISSYNATSDPSLVSSAYSKYIKFKATTSSINLLTLGTEQVAYAIDGVRILNVPTQSNTTYGPDWYVISGLDGTKEHEYTIFKKTSPYVVMLGSGGTFSGIPADASRPVVLALGDSQTEGISWGTTNDATTYYDVLWNLRLGVRTLSRGKAGNTIAAADARIATDVTPYNPDVVFVHLGYNGWSSSDYTTLINHLLAISSVDHVICAGPTGDWADWQTMNQSVKAVVEAINNPKVTWADVSQWNQTPNSLNGHHSPIGVLQLSGDNLGAIQLTNTPSDGNTATITGLDANSEIFEFDNNGSVTSGHVSVTIGADAATTASNLMAAIITEKNAGRLNVKPMTVLRTNQYGVGLSANSLAVSGANLVAFQPNQKGYLTAIQDILGPYTYYVVPTQSSVGVGNSLTGTVTASSAFDGVSQITLTLTDGSHSATATVTPQAGNTSTSWSITAPAYPGTYTLSGVSSGGSVNTNPSSQNIIVTDSTPPTTTANVNSGSYNVSKTVTLSCTDGTGVGCDKTYYTLDGTDPTTGSTQYLTPISIPDNATTTLKFFSQDANNNSETIKSKTYTIDKIAPTLAFTDDVAAGPVQSDTITADWGDATIKKWKYNSNTTCSTVAGSYTKTGSDLITQTTEDNNGKYICLYGEDSVGNISTLASAYPVNITLINLTITDYYPNNVIFPVTTTSVTFDLTTNENALCKYSIASGADFSSMTNFDSTNDVHHIANIVGLNSGTVYNFYIKCTDATAKFVELPIQFSVAPLENKISLKAVKVKIKRATNKFKDTIYSFKKKIKLKSQDLNLANGRVEIFKGNKKITTILNDANGFWSGNIKLKGGSSSWIKLRMYDNFGTLISTSKAKIKVDTEKPKFVSDWLPWRIIRATTVLNFEAKDNIGVDNYKIEIGGKNFTTKEGKWTVSNEIPVGLQKIRIKAFDEAGNYASEWRMLYVK